MPAYNLGNLWRRLGLPNRIKSWSLTSLQHRLMKTGGRLVKHARYYWLLLAEGHLNRRLFGDMLHRIWVEALPDGIEGFKTPRPFGGVNADTIGGAMVVRSHRLLSRWSSAASFETGLSH